jgi:multisubunit Na+/H+ antiporter MnhG subunit
VTQPGQGGSGGGGNFDPDAGEGGGLFGLGNLGETLERIAARGLWVSLGAMAIIAGVVFMVQDTKAFQAVKGAATKAVTKGIA